MPKDTPETPSRPSDASRRLEQRRKKRAQRVERREDDSAPKRRRATGRKRSFSLPDDEEAAQPRRRKSAGGPKPEQTPIEFEPGSLDEGAEKVVRRLTRAGHEAYLVGGCVRDLLVGKQPKDFDVATDARPEEVRSLFRNSRIIGRRFRLVHVLFPHGHIIETATFRRNPPASGDKQDDSLLITSDNAFGDAHEDANRRDFTINGLFYDLETNTVLDWVGGMKHVRERSIETIGDPVVRFLEDPVRILRAVKFAARLDFGIAPHVYDAAVQCRGALAMAARPRLSEEVLRLMRGGAAHRSIWLLYEMGLLDVLIPELSAYVSDAPDDSVVWGLLTEVDKMTESDGQPPDDIVLWSALLLEPLLEACDSAGDRMKAANEFLEPIVERLNLPRRSSDAVRRIVAMLPRLSQGKASRLKKNVLYPSALDVLSLRRRASGGDDGLLASPAPRRESKRRRPKAAKPTTSNTND